MSNARPPKQTKREDRPRAELAGEKVKKIHKEASRL
jgi:hypothetical protein